MNTVIPLSDLHMNNMTTHTFLMCSDTKHSYSCKNTLTVLTDDHKHHMPMAVSASQQHSMISLFIIVLQPSADKTAVLTINKSAGGRLVYFYQCKNPGGEGLAGLQLHPLFPKVFTAVASCIRNCFTGKTIEDLLTSVCLERENTHTQPMNKHVI